MDISIAHLYSDVLNLYGDTGNIIAMEYRCKSRGIGVKTERFSVKDKPSLSGYDIVFIGGGQDFEQQIILSSLRLGMSDQIKSAVEDGKVFLTVCGGYQLLGNYYETADGERLDFTGAVDMYTIGAKKRMVGNIVFEYEEGDQKEKAVGFENHSGLTYLGSGVKPLGTVLKGFGNNGRDGTEGVRYNNVFATYCHGPILPKNPKLCDLILRTAAERKTGRQISLEPLDDTWEIMAHNDMIKRLLK